MENKDYAKMKTPLQYQITEYDCGQATVLNAIRYLFDRGEIPPIIIKYITQYTLDTIGENGQIGMCGTSPYAMDYLANWINKSEFLSRLGLHAIVLYKSEVDINNEKLNYYMDLGGVAIFRVWSECEHYVLCTGIDKENVYIFDPYYLDDYDYDDDKDCIVVPNKPFKYNRIVRKKRFNSNTKEDFSFVKDNERRILVLYRK